MELKGVDRMKLLELDRMTRDCTLFSCMDQATRATFTCVVQCCGDGTVPVLDRVNQATFQSLARHACRIAFQLPKRWQSEAAIRTASSILAAQVIMLQAADIHVAVEWGPEKPQPSDGTLRVPDGVLAGRFPSVLAP